VEPTPTGEPGSGGADVEHADGAEEPPDELDEELLLDVLPVPVRPVELELDEVPVPIRPVELELDEVPVPIRPVELEELLDELLLDELLLDELLLDELLLDELLLDKLPVDELLLEELLFPLPVPVPGEPVVEELPLELLPLWPEFPFPVEPPPYIPIATASCEGRLSPSTRPGRSSGSSALVITNSFLPL
jgi:hypothetical protein